MSALRLPSRLKYNVWARPPPVKERARPVDFVVEVVESPPSSPRRKDKRALLPPVVTQPPAVYYIVAGFVCGGVLGFFLSAMVGCV